MRGKDWKSRRKSARREREGKKFLSFSLCSALIFQNLLHSISMTLPVPPHHQVIAEENDRTNLGTNLSSGSPLIFSNHKCYFLNAARFQRLSIKRNAANYRLIMLIFLALVD